MSQPKRKPDRGCEECGARIDSEGFCTRGCDEGLDNGQTQSNN